jgi:hypothetical protein
MHGRFRLPIREGAPDAAAPAPGARGAAVVAVVASPRARLLEDCWVVVRVCDARRCSELPDDMAVDDQFLPTDRRYRVRRSPSYASNPRGAPLITGDPRWAAAGTPARHPRGNVPGADCSRLHALPAPIAVLQHDHSTHIALATLVQQTSRQCQPPLKDDIKLFLLNPHVNDQTRFTARKPYPR